MSTNDPLKQFITVRNSLLAERERLERQLKNINAALETNGHHIPSPRKARPTVRKKRGRGDISLKAAVLQMTKSKPLTKQEILDGARKLGWKTTSKNPLNLLNPLLYGKNPKFKNQGGKFSPA